MGDGDFYLGCRSHKNAWLRYHVYNQIVDTYTAPEVWEEFKIYEQADHVYCLFNDKWGYYVSPNGSAPGSTIRGIQGECPPEARWIIEPAGLKYVIVTLNPTPKTTT